MSQPDSPRVLHVLRSMGHGGIETWLLHVSRNMPKGLWQPEFLVHGPEPGAYDAEVSALGGRIHYGPPPHQLAGYTRNLSRLLRGNGPYQVVHSHLHFYSGIVLRTAHYEGVPVRIAHSHTPRPGAPAGRAYTALMRHLIHTHATHGLAAAAPSAEALFGSGWRMDGRYSIHNYGLDYSRFAHLPDRMQAKRALGIPPERTVIGYVARFAPEKNHAFLVSVFAELVRTWLNAHLLLIGTGALEPAIRQQVNSLGLAQRCTFAGTHNDVAPFYGAFDVFLLPSLCEGLALVALEAQAAAVPVLASTDVPEAASIIPSLVRRLSLADGVDAWADATRSILATTPRLDRAVTARALNESAFGIARSIRDLSRLYCDSARPALYREAV